MRLPCFLALASIALAVAAAAQNPGPAPRFDAWKIIGPGGGGTTIGPTISPHDPNLVVEHCDMTGGYITHDGGRSWRIFNLRSGLETFAFDPGNPRRIYAGNAALWRSDDTGRTWRMLFPNPAKKTVEHQNGDHGDYSLTSQDSHYVTGLKILQIAVDPRDSKVVHIAFSNPQSGGTTLLVSRNGGVSFRHEQEFPSDKILLLVYKGGERMAIGRQGVYRGWAKSAQPIAGPIAGPVAGSGETITHASAGEARGRTIVFATTKTGELFVSEDGGRSWQLRSPALGQQAGKFGAVAAASGHGRVAYVGFRGLKLGEGSEELYNGIAKTVDAGLSWSIVFRESTRPAANLDASWIEARAIGSGTDESRNIFFDAPYSLGVAPRNPHICYATDLFRTYRTLDGGKTWAQVNSVRTADRHWTTRGLDVTTDYGVQFDPFDAKHVFIDYTDIGAFASEDGGKSWESATNGVPDAWRNTTYWLAFDPEVKGLMWGAFSGVHDLPRPKMWRQQGALSRYRGGIGVSTDGGRHWSPSNTGMRETAFTHVLLDPATPAGRRILYACGFGAGVYKSTDNGKTWQLKNHGISETNPFAWRIVRGSDGALYLILARANEGRYGTASGSGALYKSVDGAEHWTKMKLPEGVNGPNGLALDPRDNRRIYLAAWGQERTGGVDLSGGVWLSTDGGQSWRSIFSKSQHVYDVTINPKAPDTLYICGFDAAAYRSTDAGLHWTRIRGYNFKWGHRVVMDPNDASMIYITTYGGSVWHGPAAGDPSAPEDSLTHVPIAQ
jgi:photosystem II stability/assembly factor-like uncharacterized protein